MKRSILLVTIFLSMTVVGLASYRARSGTSRNRSGPPKIIKLAEPRLSGQTSVEQALAEAKPVAGFLGEPLKHADIGQLGWAGLVAGKADVLASGLEPGATAQLTLYFATPSALFAYDPARHVFEQVSDADTRHKLAESGMNQSLISEAPCTVVVAGPLRTLAVKRDKNVRKKILMQAGGVAQKIQLQAASLGLGTASFGDFDIRQVSQACRLAKNLEPVLLIAVGHLAGVEVSGTGDMQPQSLTPKRAVIIVASENYRDEEFFETRAVLNEAGIETVVASSRMGVIRSMFGNLTESTVLIDQLRIDSFDAVVLIGGLGAREYIGNPLMYGLVREAADKGKVLAAISTAPRILAEAGVLSGVRATSFLSEAGVLQVAGAQYTDVPVEKDGPIITARDPAAARLFGQAIADTLLAASQANPNAPIPGP